MKKTSQDLMNGCGKEIRKEEVVKDAYEIIKCEINSLCPNCQAQKQERLDCYKKELEFLESLVFMNDVVGCDACIISKQKVQEEISQLQQEIKTLEGEK